MSGDLTCKLLIADDQTLIRDAIRRALRSRGATIDACHDGAEALRLLPRDHGYRAAVLDQRMPGASGLEVIKQLRSGATKAPHGLPLVLITGHAERAVIAAARQLDVDAVLAKPFNTKTFLQRLDRALGAPAARKPAGTYAAVALPEPCRAPTDGSPMSPHVVLAGKPAWVTAGDVHRGAGGRSQDTRLIAVDSLADGMVLGQALYAPSGQLLAGPGLQLTPRLIAKIRALAEQVDSYRWVQVMNPIPQA